VLIQLFKVKFGEINRRIKATEKEIDQVLKGLDHNADPDTDPEAWLILEEEVCSLAKWFTDMQVSDIIADVHDLAHYTRLNYTAFQKILVVILSMPY